VTTQKKTTKKSPRKKAAEGKSADVNAKLTNEQKIGFLTTMLRIRRFEERSLRVYQQGKIGGFLHLYIGQEAVAVGTVSMMGEHDHVITAYRDHGHALAVGMGMNECMAELYGKYTGCSKGKGGSMHFFAPDKNYWGGHGIVAGQTPLGAGIAFALKYQGLKGSCMCFMGDGAVNQGAYHEALNLAGLWDLPVIYIIENNGYSMGTSQERSSAGEILAKRAEGYNIAWDICDGHDLEEVRQKTSEAMARAHNECKPTILEIDTYRYRGHSVADPDKTYRTKDEIAEYQRTKDPINLYREKLISQGVLTQEEAKEIDKAARAEADESVKFAEQSPFPPVEEITRDVYWEEDHPEHKVSQGRIFFQDPPTEG